MQKIELVWGKRQEEMALLGMSGDIRATEMAIDVTFIEESLPNAAYSIHIRRADGWTYPAAIGLHSDDNKMISYVFEEVDLAVSGAIWITICADLPHIAKGEVLKQFTLFPPDGAHDSYQSSLGHNHAQMAVIGWISKGAYDGMEPPKPYWVSEVLAFASEFSGISAKIALLPPNARPAAAFVQEADGMKLVLSLPDTSGIGDGGHAIFSAADEADLLTLTEASIGDQAITLDGDVYMCVDGDPTQPSSWALLSADKSGADHSDNIDALIAELQERVNELAQAADELDQFVGELGGELNAMEETVNELTLMMTETRQTHGLLKGNGESITAAEPGVDYVTPPITLDVEVTPSMWLDGEAYVYDLRITEGSLGMLRLASGATAGQYALYAQTQPFVSSQWDGGLSVSANGTIPEASLFVQIIILN